MSRINTGVAAKKIVGMEKTTDHGEEKPTLYYVHFADDSHEKVPGALLQRLESKVCSSKGWTQSEHLAILPTSDAFRVPRRAVLQGQDR